MKNSLSVTKLTKNSSKHIRNEAENKVESIFKIELIVNVRPLSIKYYLEY